MRIEITPFDTLFFRDGKPFTMGAESWGNGIFPPYPSIIYGVLRSAYFSHNINELKNSSGDTDPTSQLRLKGFYLKHNNSCYFPVPLDCVVEKEDLHENKLLVLKESVCDCVTTSRTNVILVPPENKEVENPDDACISSITLTEYLNGEYDNLRFKRISDFVLQEPKIGIRKHNLTKTAEDSMLYRVGMKRLINASIVAEYEGLEIPSTGLIKAGGESRPVYYTVSEANPIIKINNTNGFNTKKFKLYLSTPAIFENGWIPDGIDETSLRGEINGLELQLITAAIGKPLYIGGFDIKKGHPKPMKRAVPAGSVYYFESLKDYDTKTIIETLHNTSIVKNENYSKQGFGIAFVGRCL